MANAMRGEATLKIDGQRFTLVMDYNALIEAEDAADKPFKELMKQAQAQRLGAIRALFYAALRENHRSVTIAEAGDMIAQHGEAVAEALSEALSAAFPDGEEQEDGDKPNPPPAASGRRSKAGARQG